jgi:hypothetical protein
MQRIAVLTTDPGFLDAFAPVVAEMHQEIEFVFYTEVQALTQEYFDAVLYCGWPCDDAVINILIPIFSVRRILFFRYRDVVLGIKRIFRYSSNFDLTNPYVSIGYMVMPFDPEEVILRIHGMLKKDRGNPDGMIFPIQRNRN